MKKEQKKLRVRPLGDRVIIKELTEKDGRKTDSGIYIPDTVKEDKGAKRGEVVAVGAGRMEEGKRIPLEVSVGDTVLYQWGDKMVIDDEEYVLVRESEIAAIIK